MDIQVYHGDTRRVSKSGLDKIRQSPAHYWYWYLNPARPKQEHTPATRLGSLFHTAMLEVDKLQRYFVVAPEVDRRTKAGREEWDQLHASAETNRQTIVTQVEVDKARRMRDAAYSNPIVIDLMSAPGQNEKTILFDEPMTGAACKCRPDRLLDSGWIIDFKTTDNAAAEAFGRSAYKYRYHVQSAFYLDGMNYGMNIKPEGFVFVAVETKEPYQVAVYVADQDSIELGRGEYLHDLETYMRCKTLNQWPGYQPDGKAQLLQLPHYAYPKLR